ncbi:hypothetical protein OAL15_01825 [Flavobacteriales bacterium]|nr:hypothetical protein [Flavobacteriales bacterium]
MKVLTNSRTAGVIVLLVAFVFNEWAFRIIFPLGPIDSFLRLMVLVLDCFILPFVIAFIWKKESFTKRLTSILTRNPKVVAIYIGLFVSYAFGIAIEFSCRYYFKHVYQAPYTEKTYWEPSANVRDSILGSSLAKDTIISHAYLVNDSLIYKQEYHIDEFGRRITPATKPDSLYNHFAIITGCSFAFGYGLNEYETLSYLVDSLMGFRSYNYGVAGHGTQQTLALLQNRNLTQEISEPNGMLIHLYIDDHIPRLIGSRRLIKLWATNFPYYHLNGEKLQRTGSFWTGRHFKTRFYRAVSQSAFIDLFDIDLPWYVSNVHLELFAAVLSESKGEFLKQYPKGEFLVVIGPNSKLAPRVVSVLEERNIRVLNLSGLLDKKQDEYKIHWTEGHPNKKYYLEITTAIRQHIKK